MTSHPSLRWLFLLLTLLGSACVPVRGQEPAPEGAQEKRTVFRLLLLIIPESRLVTKKATCNGKMTEGDIKGVSRVFQENFPRSIRRITRGRVDIEADVTVSDRPLTHVSAVGKGQFWPSPGDVKFDLNRYTRTGEYDGVFVYWMNWDGKQKKSLPGGLGYSWPGLVTHSMGYSVMVYQNPRYWTGPGPHTVFVHEWCHQLEYFYPKLGIKLPRQGLHGTHLYPGQGKQWYNLFLNGEVVEKDGTMTGLGENAWKLGTMRERHTPKYLTPERRSRNLLRNASFEEPLAGSWTLGGVRPVRNAGQIVPGLSREGQNCFVLQTGIPNELHLFQDVPVKPHTRYLFSGWISTERVQTRPDSNTGATLAVFRTSERSRSMTGNAGWTYVKTIFDSGKKTTLRVGPMLGGTKIPAVGRAAYDDLCLIEIERVDTDRDPVD